jgi:MFS superfamily sulfate permease-like transporter
MILMRWIVPAIGAACRRGDFFADLGAGLTVGLIALPLAIGFGIATTCGFGRNVTSMS